MVRECLLVHHKHGDVYTCLSAFLKDIAKTLRPVDSKCFTQPAFIHHVDVSTFFFVPIVLTSLGKNYYSPNPGPI
jgi:hypothetical protein